MVRPLAIMGEVPDGWEYAAYDPPNRATFFRNGSGEHEVVAFESDAGTYDVVLTAADDHPDLPSGEEVYSQEGLEPIVAGIAAAGMMSGASEAENIILIS